MSTVIPVTVIGGYLGAGKTTLVNHLLRAADGLRLAVLVNDFGALPIDRDLIAGSDGDTLEISGGCICCSYGSDLMEALLGLPQRRPGIDRVLIETSGVALPGMVASAVGLLQGYALDGIVVLESEPGIFYEFWFAAVSFWCDAESVLRAGYKTVLEGLGP